MPPPPPILQQALRLAWSLPWPTLVLDERGRIADASPAFEAWIGQGRKQLMGQDPLTLQQAAERASDRMARDRWLLEPEQGPLVIGERRLALADGRERWARQTIRRLDGVGEGWLLASYEDCTAEHAARLQAERTSRELAAWFDLSATGMVVYDQTGLVLRSSPGLERLLGTLPVALDEAPLALQELLGWSGGASVVEPDAAAIDRHAVVDTPDGQRRLAARLSALGSESSGLRVLASVVDRSVEEERDLAQLERGVLMDTASVGVATYDPQRGWLASRPTMGRGAAPSSLQGINRELVEEGSRAAYERLQQALKAGEAAEVRYAVRHPDLGRRWLLTRVAPGVLAAGRRSMSVVTLDVTEQEQARLRNEDLLRELGTILEGSTAGIASMRGLMLVRCNREFERMLGVAPGSASGATLHDLLSQDEAMRAVADEAMQAAGVGDDFEGQIVVGEGTARRWLSLAVRPAQDSGSGDVEAVAVLTDVTRLKDQQTELERLLHDRELMFNTAEVGIVYQRGAGIERANPAMAALTGYSVPELTSLDPVVLYADTRSCVEFEDRLHSELSRTGRFVGDRRLRRRDGSLRWVHVSAREVQPGRPQEGLICAYVDVDELRRARDTLVRQADRTRAVLDSVLVGIVTVVGGSIEWMNRSARRMFGGELADFVGEPISIVATPEADHPLRRTDYAQRLAEGQAEAFECRLRARDGREFWVVGNTVLSAQDAGANQLTYALLDIERRRQAEVEIAQARSSLQQVIDTAPLAIALLDARNHEVQQRNQAAAGFLAPPPRALEAALASLDHQSDEVYQFELRQTGAAGESDRVWDTRMVTMPASPGAPAQLLVVASDVTQRREADQAQLQAAIAQREVLVKEVHHRIKNNLQGVAGLLQQHAQRDPAAAATLSEAVSQVRAIAQVYGLQVGAAGLLRLDEVTRAIAASVHRTFGREIRFESPAGGTGAVVLLPEAESIPIALSINELLTNAVKHGQGEVACSLRLADTGEVGVCIEHQGRLPDGFSLDKVPSGVSGLGLVRALLPRRSSALDLRQSGDLVVTEVTLRSPSVLCDAPMPAPMGDNDTQEKGA